MATLDVNLNMTLEIDDDTWYETLEAFDGDEDEALYEIAGQLEYEEVSTIYGRAWGCSVDIGGWIDEPLEDIRPL